ncbi:phosphoethanolamine transferase CptA, partial [bacterium]|nr:phosphoethanolamine transferase CptA [bacterium]
MPRILNPPTKTHFLWSNFWIYYLFFFYFSGLPQLLIITSGMTSGVGLRQSIYMSFLWIIPILFLPRYSRTISAVSGLVLWASSLVTIGYFILYGQEFSQSVLFIIFESNISEGGEFIDSYFKWWMIPTFIMYSVIPFILWKKTKPLYAPSKLKASLIVSLSLVIIWPAFNRLLIKQTSVEKAITVQMDRMEPAAPWYLVFGYVKYKNQLHDIEQHLLANKNLAPLENLSDKDPDSKKTLVLVIGESTNKQRMSLYGYNRDTTPSLNALKDELLVFDNVYAPRPYTIETLEQVLSFADEKNPDLYLRKPTLINLMKQAGYKTYWVTNQQTQTKRNTMLTVFSKQADEQIYLNNNRRQDSAQYDGRVLEPFKKILEDNEQKKFIVIHLLGTHRKYHYRYPNDFALFDNKKVPQWLKNKSSEAQEYNEYDNAIIYNDFVVSALINTLKISTDNGFLVYLSDHGEEVYDNPQKLFAGRSEGRPTSQMYTIPFLVWRNNSWKIKNKLTDNPEIIHREYTTSDFIYTWTDLAGINFKGFDASKSIVNKDYSQHPIWIGNPG